MPNIITIPTPCHEDWNKMISRDQGRHCGSCNKTVVDFTTWQPQEILLHFKSNKNVCGRFTADQLNEPIPTQEDFVKQISYFNISTAKKMAAIFLFAFMIGSSSCNEGQTKGKILVTEGAVISNIDSNKKVPQLSTTKIITGAPIAQPITDTLPKLTGKPALHKQILVEKPTLKGDVAIVEPPMLMGEPAMVEQPIILGDTVLKNMTEKTPACKPNKSKENELLMGKIISPKIITTNKK